MTDDTVANNNERFTSFEEFWPFYLSEHNSANSRRLHFVGTSGWFASIAGSAIFNPVGFSASMLGFGLILRDAMKKEKEGPAWKHVAAMVLLPTLASPILFPAGIVWAYGCAWAGHFLIEDNRPATFKQPVWSLVGDFRMWSQMAKGKLWNTNDPVTELGLDRLMKNERPAPKRALHTTA